MRSASPLTKGIDSETAFLAAKEEKNSDKLRRMTRVVITKVQTNSLVKHLSRVKSRGQIAHTLDRRGLGRRLGVLVPKRVVNMFRQLSVSSLSQCFSVLQPLHTCFCWTCSYLPTLLNFYILKSKTFFLFAPVPIFFLRLLCDKDCMCLWLLFSPFDFVSILDYLCCHV